jgi:hypothetical protein
MQTVGRPKGLRYSVFIGVKVTPADAAKLRRLVAQDGSDRSAVLRKLVRDAPLAEDGEAEAEVLAVSE